VGTSGPLSCERVGRSGIRLLEFPLVGDIGCVGGEDGNLVVDQSERPTFFVCLGTLGSSVDREGEEDEVHIGWDTIGQKCRGWRGRCLFEYSVCRVRGRWVDAFERRAVDGLDVAY
jgi:hypothetical protein